MFNYIHKSLLGLAILFSFCHSTSISEAKEKPSSSKIAKQEKRPRRKSYKQYIKNTLERAYGSHAFLEDTIKICKEPQKVKQKKCRERKQAVESILRPIMALGNAFKDGTIPFNLENCDDIYPYPPAQAKQCFLNGKGGVVNNVVWDLTPALNMGAASLGLIYQSYIRQAIQTPKTNAQKEKVLCQNVLGFYNKSQEYIKYFETNVSPEVFEEDIPLTYQKELTQTFENFFNSRCSGFGLSLDK